LLNIQPFFVLFLAHFFIPGDRITIRKTLGILMGFAGVAFVFLEKKGISGDFQIGDMMILTASFLWSCSAVYTKRIIHAYLPFHMVLYPMIFAVPVFFIEGLLWDGAMIAHLNAKIILALLYQSLVTASFGFLAWVTMLQRYGAVGLHSFIFIMPIAGVLLGGLILGEPITFKLIVALLLIVSGILVVHFKQEKLVPLFPLGRNV
jgi:drug/metabolite transporter (DMT)-like permease